MRAAALTRRVGLAAAAVVAAATFLPPPAHAAGGTTTLKLNGPAAAALRAQGIKIVALAPAKGGTNRITMPIGAGLAGSRTTLLRQRGGIALRADGTKLVLRKLSLVLDKRPRLEARIGAEDVDLFRVLKGGRREIDPATGKVDLAKLRLRLTGAGAGAIAARLGTPRLKPGRFGELAANVAGLTPAGSGPGGGGAQPSSGCPLPSGAGPEPESPLPTLAKPVGALEIASASVDWHVRESFIRYIGTGEGTSVSGGASADPPVLLPGASAALSYGFHFPFVGGWVDRGADLASAADDTALIGFGGGVRFQFSGHGIDLTTASPEIEIAGGRSRAIFAISDSGAAAQRQVLVNLDLGKAAAIGASGNSYTYERVPGAIPSGTASSTFAGFYAPGTEFGCFSVSFSTGA